MDARVAQRVIVAQDVQLHHRDSLACVAAHNAMVAVQNAAQKVKALLLGRFVPACFAWHGPRRRDIVTDGEGLWDQIECGEIIESGNSWFGIEA
jgi:hypothetical protein